MRNRRFRDCLQVSVFILHGYVGEILTGRRGSPFLKRWMKFLEDSADLRYPTLDDLEQD